jgi:hypothetical protein
MATLKGIRKRYPASAVMIHAGESGRASHKPNRIGGRRQAKLGAAGLA